MALAEGNPTLLCGKVFCFGRSIPTSTKGQLSKAVRKCGGSTSAFANSSVTHFVTEHWEAKAASARGLVVTPQYLTDLLSAEEAIDELPYLVLPIHKVKEEQFSFVFSFDEPEEPPAEKPAEEAVNAAAFVQSLFANALGNIRAARAGAAVVKEQRQADQTAAKTVVSLAQRDPPTLTSAEKLKLAAMRRAEEVKARKAQRELEQLQQEAAARRSRWSDDTASLLSSVGSDCCSESSYGLNDDPYNVGSSHFSSFLQDDEPPPAPAPADAAAIAAEERRIAAKLKAKRKKKRAQAKKRKAAAEAAERLQRAAAIKETVRANIAKNAEEGKQKAAIWARLKQEKRTDEKAAKNSEYAERQLQWEEEQRRRHEAWKEEKKQARLEKKRKKQAFLKNRERILAEDWAEKGKKLFVGKLRFDDIKEKHKDNPYQAETLAEKRKELYRVIFRQFGLVERFKEHWDSGHFFVVFCCRIDAEAAISALSTLEGRKSACALLHHVDGASAQPSPHFYVRWPRNSNLSVRPHEGKVIALGTTSSTQATQAAAGVQNVGVSKGETAAHKPVFPPPELQTDREYCGDWGVVSRRR
eukprot:CAMPEP_0114628606 /NCGR_PEP_ID=MMETSP0168-20121206/12915_1 /TAXON_ID=95228 ORGANISM="Vannella sp., Strain DIVA3 517/6/12" /NCGR_SAMPLE_ID=MMETSP0168 /ASSEMBLY_ACC=CAM_ASM_000044 /LENGTH=583 /DNA_ID=CAMNT_0001840009 /DNA_START=14 /DNA_END=1765 /DNA_ORIENTATION=-